MSESIYFLEKIVQVKFKVLLVKKDKEIINKTINHLPNLVGLMQNKNSTYIKQVVDLSFEEINILMIYNLSLKKTDTKRMDQVLYTIINQIKNIAILLSPIIPESSKKYSKYLI